MPSKLLFVFIWVSFVCLCVREISSDFEPCENCGGWGIYRQIAKWQTKKLVADGYTRQDPYKGQTVSDLYGFKPCVPWRVCSMEFDPDYILATEYSLELEALSLPVKSLCVREDFEPCENCGGWGIYRRIVE